MVMNVEKLNEYIALEASKLDRSIVATPSSMGELEAFAYGNHGSNDIVLMHMAVKLGYKMALNAVEYKVRQLNVDVVG